MFLKKQIPAVLILSVTLVACQAAVQSRPAPQFRTLFSNDLTNITTCTSPFQKAGEDFNAEKLRASVDETAGVGIDVHILQPGQGWVPLWKSRIYPFAQHAEWYISRYGGESSGYLGYHTYMLEGGDVVDEFVRRCRQHGLGAFISLRMNDRHYKNFVDFTREEFVKYDRRPPWIGSVSKFYMDHPEYRLGDVYPVPDRGDMNLVDYVHKYRDEIRTNNIWNWAIPEVRRHWLAYITEICENYDIDGFEMDFTRHPWLFRDETPFDERLDIMTNFVRQVRQILDGTAKEGTYRWLCTRVRFRSGGDRHQRLGLDVKRWHEAGVDIFNLSCDYVTEQQHDLAKIHKAAPDAPLYIEMSHTPLRYQPVDKTRLHGRGSPDLFMLTKPEQLYTTAHLAYSRGGRGVTAFNFAYYREHGERKGGSIAEPPFELFKILRDPEKVARKPQHYYLSYDDYDGKDFKQQTGSSFDETFSMDMAPPRGGWTTDGRLRIQMEPAFGNARCMVFFNGKPLERTDDVSEPYPTKLDEGLGNADSLRAWIVPKSLLKDGVNQVRIKFPEGCEGEMIFLDIGVR